MELEEIMSSQKKLLEKLKESEEYTLIVVGKNGSGKTTLLKSISKLYEKNVGFYNINNNRQFVEPNQSNQEEYEKGILSRIMSSGESLFDELSDNFDKDIIILDEPTATLDLFKTSITIESFIRNRSPIRVIATNDYLTLKLLSGYTDNAYNCETNKMERIDEFLNSMIDETIEELKENSPFEAINLKTYEDLKIKG